MPGKERFRQVASGRLDLDAFQQRIREGWRLVAFEWEREADVAQPPVPVQAQPGTGGLQATGPHEVPFGAQVSSDIARLAENPTEMEVLFRMMELIVEEVPYTYIADELNRAGLRTRSGRRWSAVAIFEMLPRLIEIGPAILFSDEWRRRRLGGVEVKKPVG